MLQYAIAVLGRILGGSGDAYVLALDLWAVLQWAAAMWTAVYFARGTGCQPVWAVETGLQPVRGDRAALVAATLFGGSVFAAGAFFVGVPSGWVFILTPWAIHFFLQGRPALAVLLTTATIYVHLGGITVAPFGILVAARLADRGSRSAAGGGHDLSALHPEPRSGSGMEPGAGFPAAA